MGNKSRGRPPAIIGRGFYIREPDATMRALTSLKNDGRTWQQLADELSVWRPVTLKEVWRTAKGMTQSTSIDVALGLSDPPRPRSRWSADVPPATIAALNAECDRRGLTHGELLERMRAAYDREQRLDVAWKSSMEEWQ